MAILTALGLAAVVVLPAVAVAERELRRLEHTLAPLVSRGLSSLEPLALLWIRLSIREGRNPNFTWARLTR